jgi:hypothetical protein
MKTTNPHKAAWTTRCQLDFSSQISVAAAGHVPARIAIHPHPKNATTTVAARTSVVAMALTPSGIGACTRGLNHADHVQPPRKRADRLRVTEKDEPVAHGSSLSRAAVIGASALTAAGSGLLFFGIVIDVRWWLTTVPFGIAGGLVTWALGRGRSIGKLAAAGVLVTLSSGPAVFAVFLLIYISGRGGH